MVSGDTRDLDDSTKCQHSQEGDSISTNKIRSSKIMSKSTRSTDKIINHELLRKTIISTIKITHREIVKDKGLRV